MLNFFWEYNKFCWSIEFILMGIYVILGYFPIGMEWAIDRLKELFLFIQENNEQTYIVGKEYWLPVDGLTRPVIYQPNLNQFGLYDLAFGGDFVGRIKVFRNDDGSLTEHPPKSLAIEEKSKNE